jgi:hypothetical protein
MKMEAIRVNADGTEYVSPEADLSASEWKRLALLRGKMIDDLLAQEAQRRAQEKDAAKNKDPW